jgi:DnaD/phage-associated family protein
MPRLKIYKDEFSDKTYVANCFIDEYMKDANDAQLKVYLYLLRMFQAGLATSVSDIADKFNHTEKDVIRALKYWEKNHLLTLDYDEDKTLVGIRLKDSRDIKSRTSDSRVAEPEEIKFAGQPDTAPTEETDAFSKPLYTPDQLREFKSRENTAQLLFIAESYIGKPLSPSEIKCILFFSDVLKFSDDLIDYLIQYCVDRGKKDFKYIEKVAISWAEQGIVTPEQAKKKAVRYDKNVYAIMNALGKGGTPVPKELEYINRWLHEYGFSVDVITEACERTVLATDKHRFEYAESILASWLSEGVHHKADIDRADASFQQKKRSQTKAYSDNKFNQFTQNSYDFTVLEKELLSN